MTTMQNCATQGEWLQGESEALFRELVKYLDPLPLLDRFFELVKLSVPFERLEFRHDRSALACCVPQGAAGRAGAASSCHAIAQGTLSFFREQPYRYEEKRRLAAFIELLRQPLRNAIRYHTACAVSRHPLVSEPLLDGSPAQEFFTHYELMEALGKGEFTLYYQPKVAMKSGEPVGLEALLRWNHPSHGLLSPELFIPVAEHHGVIRHVSRWVIEQVVRQCAQWRREGVLIPVAINLSGRDLADQALPDYLSGLLEAWRVPSRFIELEITETAAITDHEAGRRVLGRLARLGVGVAIDDFGIGYSSLQRLRQLPAGTIKIDKSFVIDTGHETQGMLFVDAITRLGHDLGMKVVAEGVECRECWERVVAAGCDVGQGYHISRPLPAEAMTGWLRSGAGCYRAGIG